MQQGEAAAGAGAASPCNAALARGLALGTRAGEHWAGSDGAPSDSSAAFGVSQCSPVAAKSLAALVGLQDSSPILLQTPPGLTPGCISTSPCRASVRDLPAAGAGTEPLLIIIILAAPDPHCSLPSAGIQEPTVQPRSPRSQEQPQAPFPLLLQEFLQKCCDEPCCPQPAADAPSFSSGTHAAGAAPLQSVAKKKPTNLQPQEQTP